MSVRDGEEKNGACRVDRETQKTEAAEGKVGVVEESE